MTGAPEPERAGAAGRHGGTYSLLTGPGPAGIAVVRVLGPAAGEILARHVRPARRGPAELSAGQVFRAALVGDDGLALDEMLVSVHSPPPELELRLHLHGSVGVVRACTALLEAAGLRPAARIDPPLWPAADRLEAEALELLPRVLTWRGTAWLLEQPARLRRLVAEGQRAEPAAFSAVCRAAAERLELLEWFTRPLRIVVAGPTNAGKSTLTNALGDRTASVVSARPGTTRDWVEVPAEADGFPVVWVDTAGLRPSAESIEAAAMTRTRALIADSDAILVVLDVTGAAASDRAAFCAAYSDLHPAAVALNKCDLAGPMQVDAVRAELPPAWRTAAVPVAAAGGEGLGALCEALLATLGRTAAALDGPAAFAVRQAEILREAARRPDAKTFICKRL